MEILPAEIIRKKRDGIELQEKEIKDFLAGYLNESIPDYQMSALLMSIYFNSMTDKESVALLNEMIHSGEMLSFANTKFLPVDKHSTGGVGDKTSLIIAPLVASFGIPVPMMAGRGLGHTGGTLDKLESIPGFCTQLSLEKFKKQVETLNCAIIGQTENICPADKKIYALRDLTGTVESVPLICASILSKKIAEGTKALVMDVKFGSGAFMKTIDSAKHLAESLKSMGENAGLNVSVVGSSMEQPLGKYIGNALEVFECIEILKGNTNEYRDTFDLSLKLSAKMLCASHYETDYEKSLELCKSHIKSGKAFETFEKMVSAQGGDLNQLEIPKDYLEVRSPKSGFIKSFQTENIGYAGILLGAGRKVITDKIIPQNGFKILKKVGDSVEQKEPIFHIYTDNVENLKIIQKRLIESIQIEKEPTDYIKLIEFMF